MRSSHSVNDISAKDMEEEIIFFSNGKEVDIFEKNWVNKRDNKGSTVLRFTDTTFPNVKNPKYLTKVGHGQYDDTMSMLRYCDSLNSVFIDQTKQTLTNFPTIQRINLYSCKSGLVPLAGDNKSLEARIELKKNSINKRNQFGQLSYAEYFILALEEAFQKAGESFPPNLRVVACLGDVTNSNGKPGVSSNKRKAHYPDSYVTIDKKSCLIEIDCDAFLAEFRKIYKLKQSNREVKRNTRLLLLMRGHMRYGLFSMLPTDVLIKIAANTRNPDVSTENEAMAMAQHASTDVGTIRMKTISS